MTAEQKRCKFARALVEVDIANPLPDFVDIDLPGGTSIRQLIIYEDIPKFCGHCLKLGHHEQSCHILHPKPSVPTSNPTKPTLKQSTQAGVVTQPIHDKPPLSSSTSLVPSESVANPLSLPEGGPDQQTAHPQSGAKDKGKAVVVDKDGFQIVTAKKPKKKASKGTHSSAQHILMRGSQSSPPLQ